MGGGLFVFFLITGIAGMPPPGTGTLAAKGAGCWQSVCQSSWEAGAELSCRGEGAIPLLALTRVGHGFHHRILPVCGVPGVPASFSHPKQAQRWGEKGHSHTENVGQKGCWGSGGAGAAQDTGKREVFERVPRSRDLGLIPAPARSGLRAAPASVPLGFGGGTGR